MGTYSGEVTGMAGDWRLDIVDMLSGYRTSCPGGWAKGSMGAWARGEERTQRHGKFSNPVSETVGGKWSNSDKSEGIPDINFAI
jgi:hypothetical protein